MCELQDASGGGPAWLAGLMSGFLGFMSGSRYL